MTKIWNNIFVYFFCWASLTGPPVGGGGRMDCNLAAIKWFFAFHSGLRYDFNLFHFCLVESVLKWCKAIIYGHFYVVSLWLFGSLIIIDGSRERTSERARERERLRWSHCWGCIQNWGYCTQQNAAGKGTWPQCIFDRDGKIFRTKWNGNGTIGSKMKIVCMSWHGANGFTPTGYTKIAWKSMFEKKYIKIAANERNIEKISLQPENW